MNTSALEVIGIEKTFKKFKLGPVNFTLEKGTVVALLGGNGSGKSTFFRLLMNILQAEAGTVHVLGQDMNEHETDVKRRIGFIGDMFEPFSFLKIKELADLISHWYPTWDNERYVQLLSRYQLDEDERYGKCSKGTKKKVEFVFSICHHPEILLLDEPSAHVDIVSQRKIKEDLIQYMEDGERSVVIATHNMDDVRQICDYVSVLDKGKIIYSFEKDEIHENWATVWISDLPNYLKDHPTIVSINSMGNKSLQVITDNFPQFENELLKNHITINHVGKLSLDEIIEYLI